MNFEAALVGLIGAISFALIIKVGQNTKNKYLKFFILSLSIIMTMVIVGVLSPDPAFSSDAGMYTWGLVILCFIFKPKKSKNNKTKDE